MPAAGVLDINVLVLLSGMNQQMSSRPRGMSFVLLLFAIVAVRKNVRDLAGSRPAQVRIADRLSFGSSFPKPAWTPALFFAS
jgi:hypothetical protein